MAKLYASRPSQILECHDGWTAYQVDAAVTTLGTWVEAKMAERDEKGRPLHDLEHLLKRPEPAQAGGEEHKPLKPYRDAISGKTIWR